MGKKQKYLGKTGTLIFVTFLGMVPPLSIDMYMPSLPGMAQYFGTGAFLVNFTLIAFFLFLSLGILFFGPISDRDGRKPVLIISLILYGAGSVLCAISINIYFMILVRIIQGFGAGGMVSLSMAIINDCFEGKLRASALAVCQSISVVAPVAAPVIGALVLRVATWRAVFVIMAATAVLCMVCGLLFQESIHEDKRNEGTLWESLKRIAIVAKNPEFTPFMVFISLYSAPFMAFVAMASYVYEDTFGLSPTMFSIFFGVNAAITAIGPIIYMKVNGRVSAGSIVIALVIASLASGVSGLMIGGLSPIMFFLTMIPLSMAVSAAKPFGVNILFDQIEGDAGSASSMFNFSYNVFNSLGMLIGSLPWFSYIAGISITIIALTVLAFLLWLAICKSSKINMKFQQVGI